MLWKIKMTVKTVVIKFFGRFPRLLSDENYSKLLYRIVFGKKLDVAHPKTFNEHIIAAKLEDKKYDYAQYTDKYEVRKYVENTVGAAYLNPIYGVFDSFEEIDFDQLPKQFALKATHASGFNVIVTDKDKLNREEAAKKFSRWLKTNFYYKDREKNYYRIKPRILCDKYIEFGDVLVEYKLYCFHGKVRLICQNIDKDGRRYTNVFDEDWNAVPVRFGYDRLSHPLTEKRQELTQVAEKLSAPFDFVRVDLYENNGLVQFSELTFHSGGGLVPFEPDSYDTEFGKFFEQKNDSEDSK